MQTSSSENPEFKDLLKVNQTKTKDLSKEYEAKIKKLQELFKKYNSTKKADNALIKLIEKQYGECSDIGEKRMNLANESYFLIENEIKRINLLIEKLKFEHDNLESNSFSYNNYLINKNFEEIFSIGNNITVFLVAIPAMCYSRTYSIFKEIFFYHFLLAIPAMSYSRILSFMI